MAGVIASSAGQADSMLSNPASSDRADTGAQDLASSTGTLDNSTAGSEANEQASSESVSMDTDQMAMRLALDVLWTGGGPGAAKPPVQASGSAESDVS